MTNGQLAIAMLVLLSYPLQCHPCRNSLFKVFYDETQTFMDSRKFRIMTVEKLIKVSEIVSNLKKIV